MLSLMFAALAMSTAQAWPEVTLSHGGKLRGISDSFMDTPADIFLGVRYAKPPVGELRFMKPEEFPGWKGTINATSIASPCPQIAIAGEAIGSVIGREDCLTLDITVPGGVQSSAKKPVMVFIHGGGYLGGAGMFYIGAPLAVIGDVIYVTINYRLGILGFLSTTKRTGNYGLWDQRAALLWVKENIEQFGGDPNLVTIFGESAGGGSVAAHTMSQQSQGLFKRGIIQSPSTSMMFDMSDDMKHKVLSAVTEQAKCAANSDIYDCLRNRSVDQLLAIQLPTFLIPTVDGDFFSDSISDEERSQLAHRYDLMTGSNGQEGGMLYAIMVKQFAAAHNKSIDEGIDVELTYKYLTNECSTHLTPLSPHLCVDLIIKTYQLDDAGNDKQRANRLADFLGDLWFTSSAIEHLQSHSASNKTTYGYQFTEVYEFENQFWHRPDWMNATADHADDLRYVFGSAYLTREIARDGVWKEIMSTDGVSEEFFKSDDKDSTLSLDMMKMWTNFAKTGNPNEPLTLSSGTPTWPEFTSSTNQLLELNSKHMRVIPIPNKEKLDSMRILLKDKRLQQVGHTPTFSASFQSEQPGGPHDEL